MRICNHRCLYDVCLFDCLSVSNFVQKLQNGFGWNFQGRLGQVNKWLNFGGDQGHRPGSVSLVSYQWYGSGGKKCLGGGMHCPSTSIVICFFLLPCIGGTKMVSKLTSLESRRDQLSRSFFQDISHPSSSLYHLLPPPRDTSVLSRLRTATRFTCPISRTKNVVPLLSTP